MTLHLWRVPARRVPAAVARIARDHAALRLRGAPGLGFAKLLGTSDTRSFSARDATPTRWAVLAAWQTGADAAAFEHSAIVTGWDAIARERWRVTLEPLSARGRWSRREPFHPLPHQRSAPGPVAALTRARIRVRSLPVLWRAVPPVAADLANRAGVRLALGIGEAPVGVQGTFSVWENADALAEFAYRGDPHAAVIRRTATGRWYAEELFARFTVRSAEGTVDGRDPLG